MTDRVGQHLGNYLLLRLLGSGGFAEVYLGQHTRLHTYAAIKILRTHLIGADIASFEREAQIIAGLIHPHIVHVWDFDVEQGIAFLVMDYAPNGSLRTQHAKGSKVPLPTVVSYTYQVASALQFAHDRHLIHRDVKPENILLKQEGQVILSDFGIAILAPSTNASGIFQGEGGTFPYMAPEQIKGKPSRASDQYALAICVYEWLAGERPFRGTGPEIAMQHLHAEPPSLRNSRPDILPKIEQTVFKALNKDPRGRFSTIHLFAEALYNASDADTSILTMEQADTLPHSSSVPPPLQISLPLNDSDKNEDMERNAGTPFFPQSEQRDRSFAAKSKRNFFPIILLLLCALFLGAGITYFLIGKNSFASPGMDVPVPTHITSGATVATSSGGSPISDPIATATAVSAMALYTQYTTGTPNQVYTPTNVTQWQNGSPHYGRCENQGSQGYTAIPNAAGDTQVCVAPQPITQDFALQAALVVHHGTGAALAFGFSPPDSGTYYNGDYYYFGFCRKDSGKYCPVGNVFLDHALNSSRALCMGPDPDAQYSTAGTACSKTFSAVDTAPDQPNVLTVIVVHGTIYLYLNATFVMAFHPVTPVDFTPYGQVGFAGVYGDQPTDATFTSLKVWLIQD